MFVDLGDTPAAPGVPERALPQHLDGPVHLDWRFARVQSLLARPPQSGTRAGPAVPDDDYVLETKQFLRRYYPSPPAARRRLGVQFPGPYGAIQLREEASPDLQLVVQCRILARQTDAAIARSTALAPLAIHWYEKLYFNARENLHAPDWVHAHVLRADCLENLSPQEGALKTMAYAGGVVQFESLHSGLAKPQSLESPADPDDLGENLDELLLAGIRRRLMLTVLDSAPLSPKDLALLVRQVHSLAAGKRELQGDFSQLQAIYVDAVGHTLANINFIKGDMAEEWLKEHNPNLLEYDSFAAELRDNQVYMAVSGNLAPLEHLRHRTMPPPPSRETPTVPHDFDPLEDAGGGAGPG